MPLADVIIVGVILAFFIKGWIKGFILEFTTFAGLVIAAVGSVWLYKTIPPILNRFKVPINIANAVVFIIGFLLIVYLFGILGRYFHRKAEAWDISTLNGLIGGIFGGAKGALWSGIVLLLLTKQKLLPALKTRKGSYFAKEILDATETLLKALDKIY